MRSQSLVVFSLVVLGCREQPAAPAAPPPPPAPVAAVKKAPTELRIRLRNDSPSTMERITVEFRKQVEHYDSLLAGGVTEYRTVASAYRYGFVEVFIGGERHVVQPVDFVGEKPLVPGDYTWALRLDEYGLHLTPQQP